MSSPKLKGALITGLAVVAMAVGSVGVGLLGTRADAQNQTTPPNQKAPTRPSPAPTQTQPDAGKIVTDLFNKAVADQAKKDRLAKEQAAKDQAAKEQAAKEQAAKDQLAREQAAKDQANRDRIAKEQAAKDAALKEQMAKDQLANDIKLKADMAREQARKDALAREAALKEQLAKRPMIAKRPVLTSTVDWSAALPMNDRRLTKARSAPNPMAQRMAPELDRTRLPVLLPRVGGLIDQSRGRMMSFGDAYSVNLPQKPGTTVILYGFRDHVEADKGAISKLKKTRLSGMAEDIRIAQTEDGWTATFARYGVIYSIDFACDDISAPECRGDSHFRKLITELSDVAVGEAGRKEAQSLGLVDTGAGK